MGYSYTRGNAGRWVLGCDWCGGFPARKYRCPFNWCPKTSLCSKCKKTVKDKKYGLPLMSRELHKKHGCDFQAYKASLSHLEEESMLNDGKLIRCAALSHDNPGRVKVIFRGKDGKEAAYFMSRDTYHVFPLGVNKSVEDFAAVGYIEPAYSTDIYENR